MVDALSQKRRPLDSVLLVVPLALLWNLMRRFPRLVAVSLVISVLDTAAMLLMPEMLGQAVTALTEQSTQFGLFVSVLAGVLVLPMVLAPLRSWCSQLLFTESYAWCSQKLVESAGSAVQKDSQAKRLDSWQFEVVHETIFTEVSQRIMGLVAIAALLRYDTCSVVVLFVGYRLLGKAFGVWRNSFYDLPPAEQELHERRDYLWGLLTGRASAAELRIFSMRSFLEREMARAASEENHRVWGKRGYGDRAMLVGYAVVALGLSMLMWRVLNEANQGCIGSSDIATMFGWLTLAGYVGFLGDPEFFSVNALKLYREWNVNLAVPRTEVTQAPIVSGTPALQLRQVHFSYGRAPVLKGVDLTVQRGERVAIVGANGAGKTTLIRLLLGDLKPDSGNIEVFGMAPHEALSHVGAVFQEFARLPLTVAQNIAAGSIDGKVSARATAEALEQVGLSEAIAALPEGQETILDPTQGDGVDLSGGQWQRLAIARALARAIDHGGDFLFAWDEPTSQLDPISEAEILRDFTRITSGHSCLVVTHRLGSVRHMDRVVVMADGAVAEEGTHEELMSIKGRYWEMFTAQAKKYRGEGRDEHAATT